VAWYAAMLADVVAVRRVSVALDRPLAFGIYAVGVVAATLVLAPVGFAWLAVALPVKLVAAHAVDEPAARMARRALPGGPADP
jgi:hypothetical protein